jgi:hypothetical protein
MRSLSLKIATPITAVLLIVGTALAQTARSQAGEYEGLKLYDTVQKPNCEVLLSRLDAFAAEVINSTSSTGFVVLHGGANPIENKFYELFINSYRTHRKLDKTKFILLTAASKERLTIDLLESPSGSPPSVRNVLFNLKLPISQKAWYVADDSVEVARFEGKWIYIGDCAACCIRSVNAGLLPKFLDSNPNVTAYYIVRGENLKAARNLASIILKESVKDLGIRRNRIKIVFGKMGEDSGLELWLVPRGVRPPRPGVDLLTEFKDA